MHQHLHACNRPWYVRAITLSHCCVVVVCQGCGFCGGQVKTGGDGRRRRESVQRFHLAGPTHHGLPSRERLKNTKTKTKTKKESAVVSKQARKYTLTQSKPTQPLPSPTRLYICNTHYQHTHTQIDTYNTFLSLFPPPPPKSIRLHLSLSLSLESCFVYLPTPLSLQTQILCGVLYCICFFSVLSFYFAARNIITTTRISHPFFVLFLSNFVWLLIGSVWETEATTWGGGSEDGGLLWEELPRAVERSGHDEPKP